MPDDAGMERGLDLMKYLAHHVYGDLNMKRGARYVMDSL
jgi:hypothetical protein